MSVSTPNLFPDQAPEPEVPQSVRDHFAELTHEELLEQAISLYGESRIDPLTGVYNRRGFEERFNGIVADRARSGETGKPDLFVKIDIDKFKEANDTYGHDEGDEVLRQTVDIIRQYLRRGTDILGRPGGDEFDAILSSQEPEEGQVVFERILAGLGLFAELHETEPGTSAFPPMRTISVGIAKIGEKESFEAINKRTDEALYEAKRAGRNQVVLVEDQISEDKAPAE